MRCVNLQHLKPGSALEDSPVSLVSLSGPGPEVVMQTRWESASPSITLLQRCEFSHLPLTAKMTTSDWVQPPFPSLRCTGGLPKLSQMMQFVNKFDLNFLKHPVLFWLRHVREHSDRQLSWQVRGTEKLQLYDVQLQTRSWVVTLPPAQLSDECSPACKLRCWLGFHFRPIRQCSQLLSMRDAPSSPRKLVSKTKPSLKTNIQCRPVIKPTTHYRLLL